MKDKLFTQSADEREIAFGYLAAGLPSESLNDTFERKWAIYDASKSHYGLVPSEQRGLAKNRSADAPSTEAAIRLRLGYRPPLRFGELLSFFRDRAL